MNPTAKNISYNTTNSYNTLNTINPKTKNVWVVFHGIGYLSQFFLKYFATLNADENYIIAPQAPSKYYLNDSYRHVGACWLTKTDTAIETDNVMRYMDAVMEAEQIPKHCNCIVLGFSQGVSIAMRWVARAKIHCHKLVLYAGGIPEELTEVDFKHLTAQKTEIITILGTQDEYLTPERLVHEKEKSIGIFKQGIKHITFKGGHEVKPNIINSLAP